MRHGIQRFFIHSLTVITLVLQSLFLQALVCAETAAAEGRYIISLNKQSVSAETLTARLNEALVAEGLSVQSTITPIRKIELNNDQTLLVVKSTDVQMNALSVVANSASGSGDNKDSILSEVRYVEVDQLVNADTITSTPNDWLYYSLWALQSNQQILAPQAWEITTGSSDVVVGVIDTGIDHQHSDLAANMWVNTAEIPGNSIDDDNNGVIDDIYGYDAANDDGDPLDDHGHGTHVAGTIGAVGNNGNGVIGVAPTTRLMGLKFLNASGSGYTSDAIACLNYVVEMKKRGVNIKLTNNSWGGGGYSQSLKDAITAANAEGILFVAAAGNNGRDTDATNYYPQGYDVANVLSVAATDSTSNLASFSNYGVTTVDIAAPGVSILSTYKQNQYGTMSGTSMATPHIAGVAALVYAVNANLTPAQVISLLKDTGTSLSSLAGKTVSGKLANARAAVEKALELANGPASLSGQISLSELPLAGVSIEANINGSTQYATSNNNGSFNFNNLTAGQNYTITARKTGYAFSPASTTGILSGDVTVNFAATLASFTISGQVTGTTGTVTLLVSIAGATSSVTTNSNGNYTIANVPYGSTYSVTPVLTGYQFSPSSATGSASANVTANFQAAPATYRLSGVVAFSNGKGLANASIRFGSHTITTGADGSYSISGITYGSNGVVYVQKDGFTFTPAAAAVTVTSDQSTNFTVASVRSYTFAGTVKTPNGQAIANAVLLITAIDGASRLVTTTRNGTFTVRSLPFGSLQVTVVARGYESRTSSIALTRNSLKNALALSPRTFALSGVVWNTRGEALRGATIKISGIGSATTLTTGNDGRFSVNVPHGVTAKVSVSKSGCRMTPGTATTKIDAANKALTAFVASCR